MIENLALESHGSDNLSNPHALLAKPTFLVTAFSILSISRFPLAPLLEITLVFAMLS